METGRRRSRKSKSMFAKYLDQGNGQPLVDNHRKMGNHMVDHAETPSCCKNKCQPMRGCRRPINEEDHSHWLLGQKPLPRMRQAGVVRAQPFPVVIEDSKAGIREKITSATPSTSENSHPAKRLDCGSERAQPNEEILHVDRIMNLSPQKSSNMLSKRSRLAKRKRWAKTPKFITKNKTGVSTKKTSSEPSKRSHRAKRSDSGFERAQPNQEIKDPKTDIASKQMSTMSSKRSRRAKRLNSGFERTQPAEKEDTETDVSAKEISPLPSKRSCRSKRLNSGFEKAQSTKMIDDRETDVTSNVASVSPSKRCRQATRFDSGFAREQPNEEIEDSKTDVSVNITSAACEPSKNSHPTTRLDSGFGSEVGSGSETMDVDGWPSPTASGPSEDNQDSEVTRGHGGKTQSENNHDDIEAEHLHAMAGVELLRSRIRELRRTKLELERTKLEVCEVREEARRDMEELERRANVNMAAAVQKEVVAVKEQAKVDIRTIRKESKAQQEHLQDRLASQVLANQKLQILNKQMENELKSERAKAKKGEGEIRAIEEKVLRKMDSMQRKMQGKLDAAEKERKKAVEDIKRASKMEIEGYQRTAEQAVMRYNKLIAEYNVLESRITDAARLLSPMSIRPTKDGS